MSLDPELLIEIYTEANRKGEFQKIGTGYPVGPGRILTARHVLGAEASAGIQARWHNQNGPAREWREAKIVWEDTGLDVAVLAWDAPDGLKNKYGRLRTWEPQPHHPWNSLGFAKCGYEEDKDKLKTKATSLQGTCFQYNSTGDTFDMGVDGATTLPDGWQGVSGCPVFVDGSIVGVVVQCPAGFNQERLRAVSGRNFFNDPEFKKAIQLPTDNPHRTRVRNAMIDALKEHDWLFAAVCAVEKTNASPSELVDHLLSKDLEAFLFGFRRVCVELRKKWDSEKFPRVIWDVVSEAMPVFLETPLPTLHGDRFLGSSANQPTKFTTHTTAEIGVASEENRSVQFASSDENPKGKSGFPRGERNIDHPPVGGYEDLNGTYLSSFDQHLIGQFSGKYGEEWSSADRLRSALKSIENSLHLGESYYHTIESKKIGNDDLTSKTIEILSERYKHLKLVRLSNDGEDMVAESSVVEHVLYLLQIKNGSPP